MKFEKKISISNVVPVLVVPVLVVPVLVVLVLVVTVLIVPILIVHGSSYCYIDPKGP